MPLLLPFLLIGFFVLMVRNRSFRRGFGKVALFAFLIPLLIFAASRALPVFVGALSELTPILIALAVVYFVFVAPTRRKAPLVARQVRPSLAPETSERPAQIPPAESVKTAPDDVAQIRLGLNLLLVRASGKLPSDLMDRLARVRDAITDALKVAREDDLLSAEAFDARQAATEYLPTAVNAYITLPRAYAEETVVQDGKTSRELLQEQFDLIENAMRAVVDGRARAGAEKLAVQGRFLREKFPARSREFEVEA